MSLFEASVVFDQHLMSIPILLLIQPASQPFLTKCSFSFKVHVHQTRKFLYFGSFSVQAIIAKNIFFTKERTFVCLSIGNLM